MSECDKKIYIGAKYIVTVPANPEWSNSNEYEPLTMVTTGSTASSASDYKVYISRQYVPAGIDILNTTYWSLFWEGDAAYVALNNRLTQAESDISSLESQLETALGDIGDINTSLSTVQSNVKELQSAIIKKADWYDTIASLRSSSTLKENTYVCTGGYYSVGDGGANIYHVRTKSSSETDNGGSLLVIGNFALDLISDKHINARQFGAYGNGTTDDTRAIQNALNYAIELDLLNGTYLISNVTGALTDVQSNTYYATAYGLLINKTITIKNGSFKLANNMPVGTTVLNIYGQNIDVSLDNVEIDGNQTNNQKTVSAEDGAMHGLRSCLNNEINLYLNNCYVHDCVSDGLALFNSESNAYITDSTFGDNARNDITLAVTGKTSIDNCTFNTTSEYIKAPNCAIDNEYDSTTFTGGIVSVSNITSNRQIMFYLYSDTLSISNATIETTQYSGLTLNNVNHINNTYINNVINEQARTTISTINSTQKCAININNSNLILQITAQTSSPTSNENLNIEFNNCILKNTTTLSNGVGMFSNVKFVDCNISSMTVGNSFETTFTVEFINCLFNTVTYPQGYLNITGNSHLNATVKNCVFDGIRGGVFTTVSSLLYVNNRILFCYPYTHIVTVTNCGTCAVAFEYNNVGTSGTIQQNIQPISESGNTAIVKLASAVTLA